MLLLMMMMVETVRLPFVCHREEQQRMIVFDESEYGFLSRGLPVRLFVCILSHSKRIHNKFRIKG